MCTAVKYSPGGHYFGRNLDLEFSYNESVVITPRNFPFQFRRLPAQRAHNAMIGIGIIADGFPLYYDATNEYGLSIAGLNFPGNAVYQSCSETSVNIAPYELIPWLLGQCRCVKEVKQLLQNAKITNIPFNSDYPLTPLHWLISDKEQSITVEPMADGIKIYDNTVHVLTNSPPFDYHMLNLVGYMSLSPSEPKSRIAPLMELQPYSRGMGALGLPGDFSSPSRFIKTVFTLQNSVCTNGKHAELSQLFHILDAVSQVEGCVKVGERYERTIYTGCCDQDRCIYYYTTYENRQITEVNMYHYPLDSVDIYAHPLITQQQTKVVF